MYRGWGGGWGQARSLIILKGHPAEPKARNNEPITMMMRYMYRELKLSVRRRDR